MNAGDVVGPYTIVDRLGAGGMGAVYRARDTRLGRDVALKQLTDRTLGSDVARRRVLREARAAAALSHPNIATIYDVLETPDGLVIVMEYVPGETLASRLQRGALTLDESLAYAVQLADALADAHDRGVIHRDLKPANVHLTPDGKAKILDFGIARSINDADDGTATLTGAQIVGTPAYMAPEQRTGGRGDQRTDVYGLGVVLFEMLTGQRPFEGLEARSAALSPGDPGDPAVRLLAPHVPEAVNELVARAMAHRPDQRFPTARALGGALRREVQARSEADTGVLPRRRARAVPVMRLLVVAASLVAVCGIGAWLIWKHPWSADVAAHSSAVGVLPFRNVSGDEANDPLAIGLSDALIVRLSSVRALRVLPIGEVREAVRTSRGPDPIARDLGAAFVVEGTLQRAGSSLEVNVALVGDDGRRRPVGLYSGDVSRLFDLHRRVAEGLTAALNQEGAIRGAPEPAAGPPTTNQEAFADYAQARVFLERPDVPGSLSHAITLLKSAIARDNRFALAHAGLGEAYWAQYTETKDPAWTVKAQSENLEALRIDPQQPEVRMALAIMYEGLGRYNDATEELRQVLALQPRSDSAHLVLARIHAERGAWDAAAAEANLAISLRPNYWRNYAELSDIMRRAGRFEEAAAVCNRLIQLQPDSARGYQRMGTILQSAGRLDEALQNYEKADAIHPSFGVYSNMGTLYYWRGDNAKAAAAYQHAIDLSPNHPDLYANLGDAMQKLGQSGQAADNYRRAIVETRKALEVKPNDPLNLAALALYQAKLGKRNEAASSIELASTLSPQDGEVLYVRAVVHALSGNVTAACTAIGDALQQGKSPEEVWRADELKSLKGCPAYDRLHANAR